VTEQPSRRAATAAAKPAGPPPTTTTSDRVTTGTAREDSAIVSGCDIGLSIQVGVIGCQRITRRSISVMVRKKVTENAEPTITVAYSMALSKL